MKKILPLFIIMFLMGSLLTGCSSPTEQPPSDQPTPADETAYPEKNLSGIVQWGAGGGTDSLMRPLASIAEKELGVSIVVENKTGGTGSIATQYVYDAPSDGYTLLMGAENPQLYTMLEIINLTYADFEPVFVIGDETVGVVVGKDSGYTSITELIDAAHAKPGELTVATTGAGGLPWTVTSYLTAITGATFTQVPYDSDATARTAVITGECDFTIAKVQSALEAHKAGDLKYISMLALDQVEALSEIPLITEAYPEFAEYLPWGPFYGIFVKADTDPAIVQILSEAFGKAFNDPSYQQVLSQFNINPMGLTGEPAKEFLKTWQVNTANALYKAGAITKSPVELGIQ
ncbi:tripartite tricarboxylate transporter substrate-binding protein [Acidaminobacter hydrogenoformans]|uniref:Tripartite-type tricarboxylate transporter, receptor component TctC n=1 Tax=Acidaminobacter hydrogenoformans DSM 2784 TaxID=1120920 RepID=A0A1G5RYV4_9FIRM|nr:tripartite tricarboxylate transporter substrate-binding protein [Acidaminobacter hydrogenoformans]SCZ79304.1 Tripartite-type tricarboxylate transporter, receptor component TctC [Acidaminobacter hydrogenoformans DSM 2784]